ncbi:FxLYD domain-containing protein [Natronococcus sp. A-GB7]|uniref:FxLYD domain-containing protein n=1 Tax=Natronococcus sp. A-GB7 TaxID=3037649 RepID=UPI00241C66ED|nr:FxLYD domain-containing protein [Natronococcus sp. A-GB7]MDG5817828.1 FxLYD domain-containing protein [Natronococcus sp. A-GB7]
MSRDRSTRRRVLGAVGAGTAALLAGCGDITGSDAPDYESGEVGEIDGEDRSAEEMTAAESLAEVEPNEGVTTLEPLSLDSHEFVMEDDYRGATVQGTVENTGDDRIQLIEIRVRVYNDEGEQVGRYLDVGGDLDPGASWAFTVIILEPLADIDDYEVAAIGTPA